MFLEYNYVFFQVYNPESQIIVEMLLLLLFAILLVQTLLLFSCLLALGIPIPNPIVFLSVGLYEKSLQPNLYFQFSRVRLA